MQSTNVHIGFSIIFARISDGIGRSRAFIFAWILFSSFSLASGLAQSMNQLIIFRAIQGIGGSGLFSLTMIVLPEVSPARLWGIISGLVGMCLACSFIVGMVNGILPR
jgi:MFS family permease